MIHKAPIEFSRTVTLDEAARQREPMTIRASADERAALARRFGLISLDALAATLAFKVSGDTAMVHGQLSATLAQACSATGEPIAVALDEPFVLRFEPEPLNEIPDAPDEDWEIELDASDCDVMHYERDSIDLGEAVAQTLLLSLDPYPRIANADAFLAAKGVKSEEEAGPFGALAALKDKLGKS